MRQSIEPQRILDSKRAAVADEATDGTVAALPATDAQNASVRVEERS